jgi:uncharacterized protein with HEPN domain
MQPKTPKLLEDIRDATHGYDLIDHRIVWSTIDEEVPVLLAEVEALLDRPR